MNDRPERHARDHWRDEERRDHGHSGRDYTGQDYSGEFGRDTWGRSGSTGAPPPRGDDWSSRGANLRGDRRTHDWEVGDRNYTGQSSGAPSRYAGRGYGPATPDTFTGDDYGGGMRAWAGTGSMGSGFGAAPSYTGYSGRGSYGDDDGRGFMDRAVDEVRSWFGDEDAERRREEDHRGRGPSDYTRSDERIREDANDRLTEDPRLDARQISVAVTEGEVTLTGTVSSRSDKRRAEDCVDAISGVKHVQNNLRVRSGSALEGQGGTLGWGGGGSSTTPAA